MDSSTTRIIQSLQVKRMGEPIPNGIQKSLIQQGIPAAILHPVGLLHIRFKNTYGLSKTQGTHMDLPQRNPNAMGFKASGA